MGASTFGAVAFTGSGLDDMTKSSSARYNNYPDRTYRIQIDANGTPDTFSWSRDGTTSWVQTAVPIPGAGQGIELEDGVVVEFAATTGHTIGDYWTMDASQTYTNVAEVVDTSGPSIEQATHEAPSQDITWMKKVAGLVTAGQVTFDVNFIPKDSTHDDATGLLSLIGLQYVTWWELVFNDAGVGTPSKWDFSAYCVTFDHDIPVDGILKSSVTLEINGQPVFTKGT